MIPKHESRPTPRVHSRRRGRNFRRPVAMAQRLVTGLHTLLYRLSDGRIGGRLGNAPILLLFTVGRDYSQPSKGLGF